MKKYAIAIIFYLAPQIVLSAGWSEVGKVTRIHSGHGTGTMYFSTATQISNPVCPDNSSGYTFSDSSTNADKIYSLLLSAYVSKNPVSIFVTDTCLTGRPQVNAVQFKDPGVSF